MGEDDIFESSRRLELAERQVEAAERIATALEMLAHPLLRIASATEAQLA